MRSISKPILALGVIVVFLLGAILHLTRHSPRQEVQQEKESARPEREQPNSKKHVRAEPETIAMTPKPSPIAKATTEKKEMRALSNSSALRVNYTASRALNFWGPIRAR